MTHQHSQVRHFGHSEPKRFTIARETRDQAEQRNQPLQFYWGVNRTRGFPDEDLTLLLVPSQRRGRNNLQSSRKRKSLTHLGQLKHPPPGRRLSHTCLKVHWGTANCPRQRLFRGGRQNQPWCSELVMGPRAPVLCQVLGFAFATCLGTPLQVRHLTCLSLDHPPPGAALLVPGSFPLAFKLPSKLQSGSAPPSCPSSQAACLHPHQLGPLLQDGWQPQLACQPPLLLLPLFSYAPLSEPNG